MNWSDLNRRLDEPLEIEDALLIARHFSLDPDQFSAQPTLRQFVDAGNLSLGDVTRLLEPDWRENLESEWENEPFDEENPVLIQAEQELSQNLESLERSVPISGEPAHYFAHAPAVVDLYGRPSPAEPGVTSAEAQWLAQKFDLPTIPSEGMKLGQIVEDNELDPQMVTNSLELFHQGTVHPQPVQPRRIQRKRDLIDLNNPHDVSRAYDVLRGEHMGRQLKYAFYTLIVFVALAIVVSLAKSCSNTPLPPANFPGLLAISSENPSTRQIHLSYS